MNSYSQSEFQLNSISTKPSQTIVLTDRNGVIIYANPVLETITGKPIDFWIEKHILEIFTSKSQLHFLEVEKVLKKGKTIHDFFEVNATEQEFYNCSGTIIPNIQDKKIVGYVCIFINEEEISTIKNKLLFKDRLHQKSSFALQQLIKSPDLSNGLKNTIQHLKEATQAKWTGFILSNGQKECRFFSSETIENEDLLNSLLNKLDFTRTNTRIIDAQDSNKVELPFNLSSLNLNWVIIPLYWNEKIEGYLFLGFEFDTFIYAKEETALLENISYSIAAYIRSVRQSQEFEKQRTFYENVLNNIPSDLVVFDQNHRYVFINPVAIKDEQVRKWLIGKDDYDYVTFRNKPVEIAEKRRKQFNDAVQSKTMRYWEEKLIANDGSDNWILRNMYPVFNERNELEMVIGYGLDITSRVKQEQELIRTRETAIELQKAKEKFLAKVSHEIRTPMNGVLGVINLLEETTLNNEQTKHIGLLKDSAAHLMHLIDDILDFSQLQEGKFQLNNVAFNLNEVVQGVIIAMQPKIEAKKLQFIIQLPTDSNQWVKADPIRLRQILINLLSNAIKFTDSGFVRLSLKTKQSVTDEIIHCLFSIQDSGIGINADKQQKLFEAFQQASNKVVQQYGGTGLGLSIVKELTQLMQGSIQLDSDEGKGALFTVNLPFEKVNQSEIETQSDTQTKIQYPLFGMSVLIVDDHEINRIVASTMLEKWGCTIEVAQNGQECINKLKENHFHAILMDMQMPIMDGIEATRRIRKSNYDFSTIPIIAMTAAALPEERERCLNSGMNDYLSKPFNPDHLLSLLQKYKNTISHTTETKMMKVKTEINESKVPQVEDDLYNLNYLKEVSGGNQEFMEQMITMFKTDLAVLYSDMFSNLEKNDLEQISRLAHKAKSMAGFMNATSLRESLQTIEHQCVADSFPTEQALQLIEKSRFIFLKIINLINSKK